MHIAVSHIAGFALMTRVFLGLSSYLTFIRNACNAFGTHSVGVFAAACLNMKENMCFNCFQSNFEFFSTASCWTENKNFSFIAVGRRWDDFSTQLILIYGDASQQREQGCGEEQLILLWANECLLIKTWPLSRISAARLGPRITLAASLRNH